MKLSGQIPQRVQAAWRDDRGAGYFSVLFVMVLGLTAVASLSLLIDGGRIAGARRQADMISFQAARAAAQALDEGALYHGEVVVVTDAAADAAASATGDLLARAGLEGRMTGIDVAGRRITVTVDVDRGLTVSTLFGRSTVTVTGSGTTRVGAGVTSEETPLP
jgi:Tfp pilus assembly protein PilX